ncbi:hypothetical protein LSCM1_07044 [Leishmania martiniquensis]|uniref:Leishmanolysin n=1 Tax=Leishmania martiniquensis TaxID=1580590 RepID=A0A836H128_9TRYP|nr:hypothetical protein LSCM1_07044 [Leishmania martiniquensis]
MSASIAHAAARLVCLAAAAVAIAVSAAAVCAQAAGHRCIHDAVQDLVLRSAAQQGSGPAALSAMGLPRVSLAPSNDAGAAGLAAANSMPTSPPRARGWGPVRIFVSTYGLTDPFYYCREVGQVVTNHSGGVAICKEEDILTEQKRNALNAYLDAAVKMHSDRLHVDQLVREILRVGVMVGPVCSTFKVPPEHQAEGIPGYDFVLYVGATPAAGDIEAFAAVCQTLPDGRPAVGVMNVAPARITTPGSRHMKRVVTHELTHALGFGKLFFQEKHLIVMVPGGRGRGSPVPVLKGPTVVQRAQEHYGCRDLQHVELENLGPSNTVGSHWKMRSMKDELMGPITIAGYYTNLTLGALNDLGYYRANFGLGEEMKWGRGAGCDLFTEKCMERNITKWPEMFCNDSAPELRCPTDRLALGQCQIITYTGALPLQYQYFDRPNLGGRLNFMDFCPFVNGLGNALCTQDPAKAPGPLKLFNVFSELSRCIDGAFKPKNVRIPVNKFSGLCASVLCDPPTKTYKIRVAGSDRNVPCRDRQRILLGPLTDQFEAGGYLDCPPFVEVCQGNNLAAVASDAGEGTGSGAGDTAALQL